MKKIIYCCISAALLGLYLTTSLYAGTLPKIEQALEAWTGDKKVFLQTEAADPLASAELLPLIETFLQYNFAVSTSADAGPSPTGLKAEIRSSKEQTMIVLTKAADNSIIAIQRQPSPGQTAKPAAAAVATAAVTAAPQQQAPVQLEDQPIALVQLGSANAAITLALLTDTGVTLYSLQGKQLHKLSQVKPPAKGLRPLVLSRGDLNGDGAYEISAIWAEDIASIYDGTNSKIISQILGVEQQKLTQLGQVDGYVRLTATGGFIQQRAEFEAFSGAVKIFEYQAERFSSGQEQSWGGRNILSLTPWSDKDALAWTKPGVLAAVALDSGDPLPAGTLIENFGAAHITEIAVRMEDPEFRSGFEKEDKIMEQYISLPQRITRLSDDAMLTIYLGRKDANFFSSPVGEDRLALLKKSPDGLTLTYPFQAVKAFIFDFAAIVSNDGVGALLLLNSKANGRGQASLVYQGEPVK